MTSNSGPSLNGMGHPFPFFEHLSAEESYKHILADLGAHYWLKGALFRAWQMDPVDAADDAFILNLVLRKRCDELLRRAEAEVELDVLLDPTDEELRRSPSA